MFRLYDAIRKREFIELNSDFFSRKLLLYLFEQNALDEGDYQFMLDMFNKRDKDSITYGQQRKINAVVGFTSKSYLQRKLAGKYR